MFYIVARELNHRFNAVTILFIIASQVGKLCVYGLSLRYPRLLFGQPPLNKGAVLFFYLLRTSKIANFK
ncbi:hypothetical protein QFZ80_004071 [Paenibacillus sp. V4I7]|nr:hypothetical protein [Paenibacillus sp. V4I7]